MGRSVTIRKLVGVNSISIKAIRKILSVPGLTVAKVSILVGGPDWPTSVLTGILRLNVWQMLLGSLPVFFLIVPTVLAGAFLIRANDGGVWESVSSVTLAVAAIVQLGGLIGAGYYISKVAEKHAEELDAMENDKDVEEAEIRERTKLELYLARTDWFVDFPLWMKINLVLGAILSISSCYILGFASSFAFEEFSITDSIDEKLDGNAANLIKNPFGYIVIGVISAVIISVCIFKIWARIRVAKTPSDFQIPITIHEIVDEEPKEHAYQVAHNIEALPSVE